ncbi:MAG: RNA polymerase sigma factor [Elusimicrobiota bacterium]
MVSDIELVNSAKKGDHAAFTQLATKYKGTVFNIIYYITRGNEAADDIAQEVFLKVYFSLHQFRGISLFSTWLYRITVNECLDEMKKRKYKIVSIEDPVFENNQGAIKDLLESREESAEKQLLDKETREFVRRLIISLPDKYRLIITLRDLEDLSYTEISGIMNISLDKVKVWLFRARQKLREKIDLSKEVVGNELPSI